MRILSIVVGMLLSASHIFGVIIEIDEIDAVKHYVDETTFVVFDIDNTLIEPVQELGNDQWFRYRFKEMAQSGMTQDEALEQTLLDWEKIRNVTTMKLVEETAAKLITDLECDELTVIGLTTQSYSLAKVTIHHLRSLGIDFLMTAPSKQDYAYVTDRCYLYKRGILFTNGGHKGKALKRLFEECDVWPKKVVFVNDKHSHLLPVEETCEQLGIEYVGLRYGYLDSRVDAFRPEVAEYQWDHFGEIPSDEEAEAELARACP